jgi:uncharacterized protein (TIGR02453 family)
MAAYELESVLAFLSDLALNNKRVWFEEHKAAYQEAKATFDRLVNELIGRLSVFEDLTGLAAKDCVMRIYRDIRFSKDKTPYNTSMTAMIVAGGKKSRRAGFGLRLAPNDSAVAGGFWELTSEQLARFRHALGRDLRVFSEILGDPTFAVTFDGLKGERLKTVPQGYGKDHPAAEILRFKQLYVMRSFPDQAVFAGDFVDRLVDTFRVMKPFLDYLNKVVV